MTFYDTNKYNIIFMSFFDTIIYKLINTVFLLYEFIYYSIG
jgi:hypothetical protein